MTLSMQLLPGLLCAAPLATVFAGASAAPPAHAAEPAPETADAPDLNAMAIEQLLNVEVSTASKFAQKISDVPSVVSVITAEDIRRYGYRTLADILRAVRGVYVTYDRNYSYVGTRGSGRPGDFNTRLLILVDGRRQNDLSYDQGAVGTEFPIDVSLIERIEFIPGPGSAMYGSSAFFGVLNVITKTAATMPGTSLIASAGAEGARQVQLASGAGHAGGAQLLLSATDFKRAGRDQYFPEYDDAVQHAGMATHLDFDRATRLFAKVALGELSFGAYAARRTKGIPTASYGQQFNDPRSRTTDAYGAANATWQSAPGQALSLYASLYLSTYHYSGTYIYQADSATRNIDEAESRTAGAEVRLLSTAWRRHHLIAGAEFARDVMRRMFNHDIDPDHVNIDRDVPNRRAGVYVQDEYRAGERLIATAGVRHDDDAEGGATNSPRLALVFKATPSTTLKGLVGTAYRMPNAFERYFGTAMGFKDNPGLQPERIKTYEVTAEYFPTEHFRASLSAFRYQIDDLIALDTDPVDKLLHYVNIDAAVSRGVELEAEWLRPNGASLRTSASVQTARNGATGEWLSNSPRQLYKLNYSMPLWSERLRASLEFQHTSRRRTVLDGMVGGFGVLNLTVLAHTAGERAELSASIYNLLDKRYADSPSDEHYDNSMPPRYLQSIRQDGRAWRIQARYRF